MAMSDTDRPEDEREPEGFGTRDPFEESTDNVAEEPDHDDSAPADEPDQLDLGDDDASLPWLEGDDDFEDEGGGGGQFVLLALMALAALVLIIGGIWWFTRDRGDADLVADGSVIEAPDEPYKEKPEDPGGKTFEGTGDTSYAVSEGETRTAQLGTDKPAPKPGFDAVGSAAKSDKPAATPPKAAATSAASEPAPAPAPSGPGVQVGAFSSRSSAEDAWSRLGATHSALSGLKYRIVEGRADIGTVYRLQALPGDAAAAKALCARLKSAGQDCAVKN